VRRIIFVQDTVYLPGEIGGANVSLHALCRRLAPYGIEPVVIAAPERAPAPNLAGATLIRPEYPVLRSADPVGALREAAGRMAPAAIVARAPRPGERVASIADVLRQRIHIYFESGFFGREFPSPLAVPNLRYGANSPFLARMGGAYLGVPVPMIPPVIEPEAYRCRPQGDAVLFVNPVAIKGVHIAEAIARRLPHRHFLFVRSWTHHPDFPHREVSLPNVEWTASTHDMRPLFERTKLLLVPSVWEESSARVIGEAQVSGIPAVASDRGGLIESVGPGGICLPLAAPIADWCAAVEAMLGDRFRYAACARGASAHAERPDYLPARAVEQFLAYVDA